MNAKKNLCVSMAWVMAVSSTLSAVQIPAAAASADVDCSITEESITLENPNIARTFAIEDGHIQTAEILNKKISRSLVPAEGSEDFVINTVNQIAADDEGLIENNPVYNNPEPLDSADWSASLTNGSGQAFTEEEVNTLFDGDLDTYINHYQITGHPFTLDIDLDKEETIAAMSINKRPGFEEDGWGINGTTGGYELWSSNDGENWNKVTEGEIQEEDWNLHLENGRYNTGDQVRINLPEAISARHLRLVQTSVSLGSAEEFSMAELDFYAEPLNQELAEVLPTEALDRSSWTGTITNGSGQSFDAGSFEKMIDGDKNTYPDQYKYAGYPIAITIDMQEPQTVSSLSLDKRPGFTDSRYGINGTTGKYQIYTSDDAETWTFNGTGDIPREAWNLHQEGSLYNVGDTVYVNLRKAVTARYFRLVQLSDGLGSTQEMSMAEINLYSDTYTGPDYRTDEGMEAAIQIQSSDLIFQTASCEDVEDGKKLTISYEPLTQNGITWNIDEVFVLENGKDYMRSFLEITTDDPENAVIDYIDQDAFVIGEADLDTVWGHPDEAGMSSATIAAFELMLGQPVYAGGFYMGSEFPAVDTRMNEDKVQVRYYSGKNFTKMAEDNQLTTDGKFVSWQNVVGSARGTSEAEVQTDFFNYIEEISTPTSFRKQYNSWYDNMMTITDASIEKSFTEVEKNLAAQGVEPLDAYVVDDGWNTYYDGKYVATPGADRGTVPNKTGFWEINDKFPDDFYPSSLLASKLQSTFGIWIGPQGGYNYFSGFSQLMEEKGTGFSQTGGYLGRNICTGSRKYIKNFETLANDWEERYGTSYWKWDGFAGRPCTNPDHDHMTGGYHNMYYTSDMWEAWTDLFENVREKAASLDQDLFINATCYVNLSPWLLQWVNTVWLQESGDTGQTGTGERHERKIYYRDNVYYNLLKEKNVQFPVNHLYDHDPIYGVSDTSSAADETWREYMLANAMRGTAFWELYYSPSIMNEEKYEITADVLDFAEENHETLKKAKLFGAKAPNGVYGYSAWNGTEGIVSFTNPLDSAASYDLVIDAQVGAEPVVQNLKGVQVEPYVSGLLDETVSYGDTFHVEIAPHETKIFHFTAEEFGAPQILSADSLSEKSVKVRFDRRVDPVSFSALDGEASFELQDDYRSVILTFDHAVPAVLDLGWSVKNEAGEAYDGSCTVALAGNGVLVNTALSLPEEAAVSYDSLNQTLVTEDLQETKVNASLAHVNTFTVETAVSTDQTGVNLFSYGDALSVAIDEEGFVNFTLNGITASSKAVETKVLEKVSGTFGTEEHRWQTTEDVITGQVNDGAVHRIAAMKEANGMLKVYVDGRLAGTAYDAGLETWTLPAASVTLSQDGFEGSLMPAKVSSRSLSIAEVKGNDTSDWDTVMLDRSGWSAEACSEVNSTSGDANAMAALDGNLGSWWHTNYQGGDSHALADHWIQVNFGKEETFDTFWYTGRGASTNGSIKDYILELLNEDGSVKETLTGTFGSADKAAVRFGENRTAWGIRLKPVSTWNNANFAAAKELELSIAAAEMSEDELAAAKAAALAKAEGKDLSAATTLTGNALKAALQKVEHCTVSNSIAWNTLMEELDAAIENLVEAPELKAAIEKAAPVMAGTPSADAEKWNAFVASWNKAQAAMNAGSAEECRAAAEALSAAQAALGNTETSADKTLLKMAIDYAEEKAASGALEGLNEIVAARFQEALDQAKAVNADEEATQTEINDAWLQLTRMIQMLDFKADKTALNELIAQCEAMDLSGVIQDEAYGAYLAALAAAKETAGRDTALQESIEKAYTELLAAKDGLHFTSADTSLLAYLISVIDEEDLNQYADNEAKDAFLVILNQARGVLAAPESQEQVDAMTSSLNNAWLSLRLKPSEDMLKELASFADQVSALSLDDLAEEEAALLVNLQNRAFALLSSPAATKDDAQALLDEIHSEAVQNLLNQNPGKTETPADTEPSQKPADAVPGTAEKPSADTGKDKGSAAEQKSTVQSVKTAVASGFGALAAAGLAAAAGFLKLARRKKEND